MWCAKLTDAQRDAVMALIEAQGEVGPSLGGALEALDLARWDDLPDAELPWESVGAMAEAQGISEADVVWDLAAGMKNSSLGAARRSMGERARRRAA